MRLDQAVCNAEHVRQKLLPYCDRVQVGGSVRRRRPICRDIELVVIPSPAHMARLQDLVNNAWGRPSKGAFPSLYTQVTARVNLPHPPCKIDLFFCTEKIWGLIYFIRTGSAEFVRNALVHWKHLTKGGYSKGGVLHLANGDRCYTPAESDVFELLEWDWIDPWERN
jgi:DNA polymerase/3'-5' exonuclease PolX